MTDPQPGRFALALARGPILLDAGMGTRLIARGLDVRREDSASWTLSHPDDVLDVHRLDARAGADGLLTNTFTAHDGRSAREVEEVCRRAVELARSAIGPSGFVIGSLGPREDESYGVQARALAGADALILETQRYGPALRALEAVRAAVTLPVIVSVYRWDEGDSTEALIEAGAAVLGCNCTNGPDEAIALLERWDIGPAVPRLAKPNAGPPGEPPIPPERFAAAVPRLLELGVRLFGGCCGTTEAHVAALRRALDGPFNPAVDCGSIQGTDDSRG